jgi:type I restriction enzyme M protein
MLDQETKKRIDDCRNILVGKVPDPKSQVEQITIAMIYKFMYDMDLESIELGGVPTFFTGEYEKYSWGNIFDPRIGGNEMISLYGEGIVKMNLNPNIPQLFRDIFKNAYLPYRDPETLKLFLKGINGFHYSHSEKLGDAFEYLLSVLGSQGDAGQFRTPRHIIDFVVELLQPKKNERILDPACGTSGFLISSYKHILRNNTKKNLGDLITPDERNKLVENISGYDISPDMVRLSLVNLYLHNFSNPKIYEYDSLTSEDRWNEYFDVILANPPFMSPQGGIRPHKRFSIESTRAEVLFVDYIMEHLTPKGRSGIIVPEGIIFQSGKAYKSLRKSMVEKYLVGVISLPSGVFNPYSGVKTSILILDKELSQKTDKIFFGKVDNDGFDLGSQRREIEKNDLTVILKEVTDYLEGLRNGKMVECERLTYVYKGDILGSTDIGLSFDRYVKQVKVNTKYKREKLENLFIEIKNGKNVTQFDEVGKYRVSRIQTISDGTFNINLTKWTNDEVNENDFLSKGDILFSHINSYEHLAKTAIFDKEDKIIHGINLLKLKPNSSIVLPLYCLYIFKSNLFRDDARRFAQKAVNQASINTKSIKNLEIPLPPIEIQEEIVNELEQYQKIIDGSKQVIDNYKPIFDIDPSWEMKELGEITSLMTGGTPTSSKKEYYENGSINWVVSGDVNKEFIYDCEKKITELGMKSSNTKLIPIDSVLIALNGQGKTRGMVSILKTESTCNQSIISLTPINKNELSSYFLYYQLKGMYYDIRRLTGENERSGLNMKLVRSIKISLAPIEIQKSIVERLESERHIIEGNKKLIEIYTQKIQDRINKIWGE